VIQVLQERFQVAGHFYNPNIHPEEEFRRRAAEMEGYAQEIGLPLLVSSYDTWRWREAVRGLEGEPEGGLRCLACYRLRLEETAALAKKRGFTHFTTTLSISPHKRADAINAIGQEVASRHGLEFYAADFKKKDGFTKSLRLSREAGLYRQDYCGCEFSLRETGPRNRERGTCARTDL
jgi:predicted adenine nucleotide alpha hydrolase (AANH) superfamily ATPase